MSCFCHAKQEQHACCEEAHEHGHDHGHEEDRKTEIIKIAFSLVFLLLSFLFKDSSLQYVFLGFAYLAAGTEVVVSAIKGVLSGDFFDEETLMSVATVGAMAIGEYAEAVAVMVLYRIGELMQDIAVERSRKQIAETAAMHPDKATVERNGNRIVLDPKSVSVGETIVIGVGERIPLDGIVISGETRLDCSSLTGESKSVYAGPNDAVYAGTVNLVSEIKARTVALSEDSASGRLLKAIDEAAESKPALERFITRFSKVYTPCVVGMAVIIAILPPLFLSGGFREWIYRALSFLVISCPCALVLSIPLTFYSGLSLLSKRELLPKSADVIERLAGIKAMAFDKTGTLTTGEFSVLEVHPKGMTKAELLAYASMAERNSPHPIAGAIVKAAGSVLKADKAEEHVGKGVVAYTGETQIAVGNKKLFDELSVCVPDEETGVLISVNGEYAGSLEVGDTLRETAKNAVNKVKSMGISTYMLTGDIETEAVKTANMLEIDTTLFNLLPEDKEKSVRKIRAAVGPVAFVGDGMNDSPVLAGADIGIAMADRNIELATETADLLLMSGNLERIPEAVRISKRTVGTAKLNVAIALGIKTVAMILSGLGIAGMWVAVAADSGAALVCVLVALSLFRTQS